MRHLQCRRSLILVFLLMLGILASIPSVAQSTHCSEKQAMTAQDEPERIMQVAVKKRWPELYNSFTKYKGCDDGSIAEGYSDIIVKTLAKNWDSVTDLEEIFSKDATFHKFVMNHIDATADTESLRKISKSSKSCKIGTKKICLEFNAKVSSVLAK